MQPLSSDHRKVRLREFQSMILDKLNQAQHRASQPTFVGLQINQRNWLINTQDAGELIRPEKITKIPLTVPWYLGITNYRGVLVGCVDLALFHQEPILTRQKHQQLLVIHPKFSTPLGILVNKTLGLRRQDQLTFPPIIKTQKLTSGQRSWYQSGIVDQDGMAWDLLDVHQLMMQEAFLVITA
jgi:twitching motility protein PilI